MQPFLVANFQTGVDKALEPWLTPQDAFTKIQNGYVFRGILAPRKGYDQLATGGIDSSPGRPSILYDQVSETVTNGSTLPDVTGTLSNTPIQPYSVTISIASGEEVTDTGVGTFTGDVTPDPGGTIDYDTGAISFTYTGAPAGAITATYSVPGNMNPIMGIFNFINADGERRLVVLDNEIGNRLNPTTNLFVYIPFSTDLQTALGGTSFTGTTSNFWSGTMYPDKDGNARLVMVNNIDTPIFFDSSNTFKDYTNTTDNPDYVEPPTEFGGNLITALHVFYLNERLVFLRPTMGSSVIRGQRILWSGINDSSGTGDDFNASSAGYIDIPDGSWITAAIKQNNNLIIWTSESIWVLSITTSADAPFSLRRVGDADFRGSQAPYSAVDWFSQAAAMGRYGIVGTDTRQAYRIDNKLPYFARDEIEQDDTNFAKVTSGTAFEDSQWWMTYPIDEEGDTVNSEVRKRILVYGFEEKNWMQYDIPINVLGQFKTTLDIPWDNVNNNSGAHPEWESWDVTVDIWDQFYGEQGRLFTVGGDQNGYIHRMNVGVNDICANVANVTYPSDLKTQVSTDYEGFNVGDLVKFANITGCEVDGVSILNDVEAEITAVSGAIITVDIVNTGATAYTSGGVVCEGFECDFETKPLNPFTDQNKKARLHKVLFLVSQSDTNFLVDFADDRRSDYYLKDVPIDMSNNFGNADKKWVGVTVNQVANFHRMRLHRRSTNQAGSIHAFLFLMSPAGRLYT